MRRTTLWLPVLAAGLSGCVFHENEHGDPNAPSTASPHTPNDGPHIDPNAGGIPQSFGPTAQQYSGTVRLTIQNRSQTAICKMFISPTSDGSWGEDWLGPSEQIEPGSARIFGVQPNAYDLKMTTCTDQPLGEHHGLGVQADQVVEVD
jgi:hypothetical protein